MIVAPPPTSVAAANAQGLHALHLWSVEFGMASAAESFGLPENVAAALEEGGVLAERLRSLAYGLWTVPAGFVAGPLPEAPSTRPGSALRAVWVAQELLLATIVAHWEANPLLATGLFDLSVRDAVTLARRPAGELLRLAKTAGPVLRLRRDLMLGEAQAPPLAVRLRMLEAAAAARSGST
jgi:hypothetical protein